MVQTVNFSQFCDAFRDCHRNDNFSYDGKQALYDYLEQLGEDLGEPVELDVIALCCEYSEYASLDELRKEYNDIATLEDLQDKTQVIEFDTGLIIAQY